MVVSDKPSEAEQSDTTCANHRTSHTCWRAIAVSFTAYLPDPGILQRLGKPQDTSTTAASKLGHETPLISGMK